MVEIPEDTVTAEDMAEWYRIDEELGRLKKIEVLLRNKIFKHFFTNPSEGVNKIDLNDGTGAVVKGSYIINRTVDVGAFTTLRDKLIEAKVNPDDMVRWKPELNIRNYRTLTEEQRHLADQCLVIKPGMPGLEIVIPKV